jgi:capsular polysaccharide biosynthesis protein
LILILFDLTDLARGLTERGTFYSLCSRAQVFEDGAPALEAARLFHNAQLVIGAHGAGLTNIAASRVPASLIEFQIDHLGMAFQYFTILLGFEYNVLVPADGAHAGPMTVEVDRTVQVAVDALARLNATMLAL